MKVDRSLEFENGKRVRIINLKTVKNVIKNYDIQTDKVFDVLEGRKHLKRVEKLLKDNSVPFRENSTKVCASCLNAKKLEEFQVIRDRSDGLNIYCKDCFNYMNRLLYRRFKKIMNE